MKEKKLTKTIARCSACQPIFFMRAQRINKFTFYNRHIFVCMYVCVASFIADFTIAHRVDEMYKVILSFQLFSGVA